MSETEKSWADVPEWIWALMDTGEDGAQLELKSTNPKDVIGVKKVPLHLIPGTAAAHQAMAHKNGAVKYGPYNWREEGVSASVYVAACMRHLMAWYDGEELARDSGVHHLGHAIACLNIILDSQEVGNLVDDRPKPAPTAEIHARMKEK
jgi:hypothetical protein